MNYFQRKKAEISIPDGKVLESLDPERTGRVQLKSVEHRLQDLGVNPQRADIQNTLKAVFIDGASVSQEEFLNRTENTSTVMRVLKGDVAIPNFKDFCAALKDIYHEVAPDTSGHVATYIPTLARANPDRFGFSLCTVDGQMFSYGDAEVWTSIQSCVKPLIYALTCEEVGVEEVHRYVGTEPTGLKFNDMSLNRAGRPHNPYINSGAIAVCSLFRRQMSPAARFRFLLERLATMAGGQKPGFCQATYLGEFDTAYTNAAIVNFMQHENSFPEGTKVDEVLDFYIQTCAVEVNGPLLATIAATLANRGICPITNEMCLSPYTVRCTLNIMLSCGMYDYSGEWCVNVGLPAKSGVSGWIYLVIPNVLGLAVYSPRLDGCGNSVRGVNFCRKMIDKFQYSIFDQIINFSRVRRLPDPTTKEYQTEAFQAIDEDKVGYVTVAQLTSALEREGINVQSPSAQKYLKQLAQQGDKIYPADVFPEHEESVPAKMMLGRLAVPRFKEFCNDVRAIYEELLAHTSGVRPPLLEELNLIEGEPFGMAVVTVDGQCFSVGDADVNFPLFDCVVPALYGFACNEMGVDQLHQFIGKEPSVADPHGFALSNGKPFNPYHDSGALVMAAHLFHRAPAESGLKYTEFLKRLSELTDGKRLGFSQPVYLELKRTAHLLRSVSNIMKARGLYPSSVTPGQASDFLSQLWSIEATCTSLATMAATFANGGVNPFMNDKACFSPEVLKLLLSVTYACGMELFAGRWNFEVNLPAVFGQSGGLMVIVPNVMGLVFYSPRLNEYGICSRGVEFCQRLSQKYRLSVFDQLVFGNSGFVIPEKIPRRMSVVEWGDSASEGGHLEHPHYPAGYHSGVAVHHPVAQDESDL